MGGAWARHVVSAPIHEAFRRNRFRGERRRRPVALLGATPDQLGDPGPKATEMLLVVVAARFGDPPGGFLVRLTEGDPALEHPRPAGVGGEPRNVPRLVPHRLEEGRVQAIDVDVMALVRPGGDPFELGRAFGKPRPDVT